MACLQAEAVMSSREDIAAIRSASLKLSPNATAGETQAGQRNTDEAVPERERLMAEFFVAFNGRHYFYGPYRYNHLADALNYARLQRANVGAREQFGAMPAPQPVEAPSESDRQLMNTLDITFLDGVYQLGAYRYDRLAHAVAYARLGVRPCSF